MHLWRIAISLQLEIVHSASRPGRKTGKYVSPYQGLHSDRVVHSRSLRQISKGSNVRSAAPCYGGSSHRYGAPQWHDIHLAARRSGNRVRKCGYIRQSLKTYRDDGETGTRCLKGMVTVAVNVSRWPSSHLRYRTAPRGVLAGY